MEEAPEQKKQLKNPQIFFRNMAFRGQRKRSFHYRVQILNYYKNSGQSAHCYLKHPKIINEHNEQGSLLKVFY